MDNLVAKLNLRRHFLLKYPGDFSVFDCFQGDGETWAILRREFELESYWGVDPKAKKGRMKIDSLDVIRQPGFSQNVVDVDTNASPWRHYVALAGVITKPTTVFMSWAVGKANEPMLASAIGLDRLKVDPPKACFEFLSDWALPFVLGLATSHCEVLECKEAVTSSKSHRFFGLRLNPKVKHGR